MDNLPCPQLPTVGLTTSGLDTYRLKNASVYASLLKDLIESKFETNLQTDKIVQTCMELISTKQFPKAIDFMLSEIHKHSQILAEALGKTLYDSTGMSSLFDELKQEGILKSGERNRLHVLQMVLDGIDIEVHEYGKSLKPEEVNYLIEFLEIIRNLLSKAHISVGYTTLETDDYDCSFVQKNKTYWTSAGEGEGIIIVNTLTSLKLYCVSVNTCVVASHNYIA